ncbi:hypothetical protein IQ272_13440 [Chroococcidiopsidales cyanobacterium LEGE 13417]|nr:hypothetical protein [Chroococcidiopsidales cyanobacterium LEGE 13417]
MASSAVLSIYDLNVTNPKGVAIRVPPIVDWQLDWNSLQNVEKLERVIQLPDGSRLRITITPEQLNQSPITINNSATYTTAIFSIPITDFEINDPETGNMVSAATLGWSGSCTITYSG